MSFDMNMFIMYHVHVLGTEIEGSKPKKCLKAQINIQTKLLYSKHRMLSIRGKIIQFSAVAKKGHLLNLAEI